MKKIIDDHLVVYDEDNIELVNILERHFLFFKNLFSIDDNKKISLLKEDESNYRVNYISSKSIEEFLEVFLECQEEFINNSNPIDLVLETIASRNKDTKSLSLLNFNKRDYTMKLLAIYIRDNNLTTVDSIKKFILSSTDIYKDLEDNILKSHRYIVHDYLIDLLYQELLKQDHFLIERIEDINSLIQSEITAPKISIKKSNQEIPFSKLDSLVEQYFDFIKANKSWKEEYKRLRRENRILLTNTDDDKCIFRNNHADEIILRINNRITMFPIFIHEFVHYLQERRTDSLIEFPSIYFEGEAYRFIDSIEKTDLYQEFRENRMQELKRVYKDLKQLLPFLIDRKNNRLDSNRSFRILAEDLYGEGMLVRDEQLDYILKTEAILRSKINGGLTEEDRKLLSKGNELTRDDIENFMIFSVPRMYPLKESLLELLSNTERKIESIKESKCDSSLKNIIDDISNRNKPIKAMTYMLGIIYSLRLLENPTDYPNQIEDMTTLVNKGNNITHQDIYEGLYRSKEKTKQE